MKKSRRVKRELVFAQPGECYGRVLRLLGDMRMRVLGADGLERTARIRGGLLRQRVVCAVGDVVLLGLRDFEQDKADIIHIYQADEVEQLGIAGFEESDSED